MAHESSSSRYHNHAHTDKNVRFKEDTFRPVISDPIPNPSINLKSNLQDLPDLRDLSKQLSNNKPGQAFPVYSIYTEPPNLTLAETGSRSSNSQRGGASVDNFENLYSKVSVSSTLKVATPTNGRNTYVQSSPQVQVHQQQTIQSRSSAASSLRYNDDDQPVYINSNFENEI